jgi:phosphoribosylformimino-5-aminoimidazole carboxamide ribotide isomerase
MEVVPSIDLRGGLGVRLERGDYARETVYTRDPAAAVADFVASGAPRIHVVDLDAARTGESSNRPVLRAILHAAGPVPIQFGGGVRSLGAVEKLLEMGVDRVVLGTAALEAPRLVATAAARFPGRVVVAIDARAGKVAVRGWLEAGAAEVGDVVARFADLPLGGFLYTDIARDGLLGGPNVEETARIARSTRIPVFASGGVGSVADLVALAKTRVIAAAIVGRALYTGAVRLADALREVAAC